MNKRILQGAVFVFLVVLALGAAFAAQKTYAQANRGYIVVFKNQAQVDRDIPDVARGYGLAIDQTYRFALKGFAAQMSKGQADALARDPRVSYISEDKQVSIALVKEEKVRGGGTTVQPPQSIPTGISRMLAANKTNTGAGVQVAVLDTGIDLSHPDLKGNIIGGKNCSSGASYNDGNGHGTHVAGIIAALNNGIGVVGVAPDAKVWAVRVLNNAGSGSWSSVICGLDFVAARAPANGGSITVVNMSLGGSGVSDNNCGLSNNDALHQAICRARDAGVTIVVTAGNSGSDISGSVPAAYTDAVIPVSALADSDGAAGSTGPATSYGPDDTFATFSNYGTGVALGAPGVNIYSTYKGGSYATLSGTSMASPHAAGAAALYIATHPGALWSQVRDALRSLGEAAGSGHTDPSGLHPEPIAQANAL